MRQAKLRPFRRGRAKKVRLESHPPISVEQLSPAMIALHLIGLFGEIPELQPWRPKNFDWKEPPNFHEWKDFESDELYILLEPSRGELVLKEIGLSHLETCGAIVAHDTTTGGPLLVAIKKSEADVLAGFFLWQIRESMKSLTPVDWLRGCTPEKLRDRVDSLIVDGFWAEAAERAPAFFHRHGRAVVIKPELAPMTVALVEDFAAVGGPFFEVAELVCKILQGAESIEEDWQGSAQGGFQMLSPKDRQLFGAAAGTLTRRDSPFTPTDRRRIQESWDKILARGVDRDRSAFVARLERKIGGPLFTKTDSGEHKASRPLFSALIVKIVDKLLGAGVSFSKACDLTDRLLMLLATEWYDHRTPSWRRVRQRYNNQKKSRKRRIAVRNKNR